MNCCLLLPRISGFFFIRVLLFCLLAFHLEVACNISPDTISAFKENLLYKNGVLCHKKGYFQELSSKLERIGVGTLRARAHQNNTRCGKGKFSVIYAQETAYQNPSKSAKIDLHMLMKEERNNGAFFQEFTDAYCQAPEIFNIHRNHQAALAYQAALAAGDHAKTLHARCELLDHSLIEHVDASSLLVFGTADKVRSACELFRSNRDVLFAGIQLDLDVLALMNQPNCSYQKWSHQGEAQKINRVCTTIFDYDASALYFKKKQLRPLQDLFVTMLTAAYRAVLHASALYSEKRFDEQQKVYLTFYKQNLSSTEMELTRMALAGCMQDIENFGLDVTLVVPSANAELCLFIECELSRLVGPGKLKCYGSKS